MVCFSYPDVCLAQVQWDSPCPSITAPLCPPTCGLWPMPFLRSETSSDKHLLLHCFAQWGGKEFPTEMLKSWDVSALPTREGSPRRQPSPSGSSAPLCARLRHHQDHGSTDLCRGTRHGTSVPVGGKRTTFGVKAERCSRARSAAPFGWVFGGRSAHPFLGGGAAAGARQAHGGCRSTAQLKVGTKSTIKRKILSTILIAVTCFPAFLARLSRWRVLPCLMELLQSISLLLGCVPLGCNLHLKDERQGTDRCCHLIHTEQYIAIQYLFILRPDALRKGSSPPAACRRRSQPRVRWAARGLTGMQLSDPALGFVRLFLCSCWGSSWPYYSALLQTWLLCIWRSHYA